MGVGFFREVLVPDYSLMITATPVFKLAAALGFDAPRAFCIVSLRKIRDTDFGTQLVGRIMRVHKRLQGRNLPSLLQHGYLFLADHESQQGITAAAEKINRLKSQLSQTSPFTMLTRVGGNTRVQIIRIDRGHFENIKEDERSIIHARIDLEKAGLEAQQLLLRQQYLSPRDLQNHLLKRLAAEFRSHGMADVADDEERLETALDLILVRRPGLLREVEKSCSARFAITRDADPLPGFVESAFPLQPAFKNISSPPSNTRPTERLS